MNRAALWTACAAFALCLNAAAADGIRNGALNGEVVAVNDGDTLVVQVQQKRIQVRLAEIDAPELRQSFGDHAAASLADLCLQKPASLETLGADSTGRLIARVRCNEVDAGAAQVKRGMAWVSVSGKLLKQASPLFYLQDVAQRSREGLWKEPSPVAPWVWRKVQQKSH